MKAGLDPLDVLLAIALQLLPMHRQAPRDLPAMGSCSDAKHLPKRMAPQKNLSRRKNMKISNHVVLLEGPKEPALNVYPPKELEQLKSHKKHHLGVEPRVLTGIRLYAAFYA